MTEKQFYDWQTLGGTDDAIRLAEYLGNDFASHIAPDGDGFLLRFEKLGDALQRKYLSWSDPKRRQSKRLKDLADIARLVESHPELWEQLPNELQLEVDRPSLSK